MKDFLFKKLPLKSHFSFKENLDLWVNELTEGITPPFSYKWLNLQDERQDKRKTVGDNVRDKRGIVGNTVGETISSRTGSSVATKKEPRYDIGRGDKVVRNASIEKAKLYRVNSKNFTSKYLKFISFVKIKISFLFLVFHYVFRY